MSAIDAIGRERLEALLGGDAPRNDAEARRSALLADLRRATVPLPDSLRARVLDARPQPARSRFARRPPNRLVLAVVPVALGVAVTAAVVHGLTTGSGAPRATDAPVATTVQASKRFAAPPALRATGSAGSGATTAHGGFVTAAPQATLAPSTSGAGRLQHTDASLHVRVPDIEHLSTATTAATRIATSLGGYAQSVDYQTPRGADGSAQIELRVPAENVQRALTRLAGLGTLVSQEVSVDDLQHTLQVQSDQVAQLRRTIAALQRALADPALADAQRVFVRIRLAESKRALSQRLHARNGTIAAGTTARISLVLGTERSVVAPAPPRGRTSRMLHSAVGFLGLEGMVVLYALIVISPLALLAGLGWGLARARRRRDERRLLAA
jgi:hypothetical protein